MPATQPHTRPAAAPCGPYETEAGTRPVTRPVYDAVRALNGPAAVGAMKPHNLAMLTGATEAAGVQLGAHDRRIMAWLSGWEPATCAVIAGLVTRAHEAGQAASALRADGPRCQRCNSLKTDDGNDWCAPREDADAREALAALRDATARKDGDQQ